MKQMPAYFQDHQKTLHDISCDNNKDEYMCTGTLTVFDFDALKNWYVEEYVSNLTKAPCSNDALWLDNNHSVFIEFKNGKINSGENIKIIMIAYSCFLMINSIFLGIARISDPTSPIRGSIWTIYWSITEKSMMKNILPRKREKD